MSYHDSPLMVWHGANLGLPCLSCQIHKKNSCGVLCVLLVLGGFCPAGLDCDPLTCAFCVPGITGAHTACWLR
jgi:hypothetical protein